MLVRNIDCEAEIADEAGMIFADHWGILVESRALRISFTVQAILIPVGRQCVAIVFSLFALNN